MKVTTSKKKVAVGRRFGRLVIIGRDTDYIRPNDSKPRPRWICQCDCGNKHSVISSNLTLRHVRSCGCLQKEQVGAKHYNWKGGIQRTNEGYIRRLDPTHHHANNRGYVLEHIAVMTATLGRPLLPGETVHHKNGIKDDNRAKNLEILLHHPPGQRICDMLVWAKEILMRYGTGASDMIGNEPDDK